MARARRPSPARRNHEERHDVASVVRPLRPVPAHPNSAARGHVPEDLVSHPHDDTTPVEHDPTGMRALLASLPEPGPMPADLVARISAALAAEARRRHGIDELGSLETGRVAAESTSQHDGPDVGGQVVPLRRRLGLRQLGVAATVVGVLGLGAFLVTSVPGDVTASFGTSAGSSDSREADTAVRAQGHAALVAPAAGSGEIVIVMSGVDHTSTRLDVTARELDDGTLDAIADRSAASPSLGPLATAVGARSCATALGIPADAGILVDISEVDGRSGAVLVVHSGQGRTAWAVDHSCTKGHTGLIRGPVPLD